MDIEIIEMTERKTSFVLKDSTPAMANALRRTILTDIPKMAIDKVEFHLGPIMVDGKEYESITPLFDEIIAHRLGMIPIPTDLQLFVPQKECSSCGGEGCPSCTIMYSLNKIGPCTVLSGDLMPLGSPDYKVKDEFIPIVELADGQAVLIYTIATMGTAKAHVKWQVANGVGYKYASSIKIDAGRCKHCMKCFAECPKDVFSGDAKKANVANPRECILCRSCERFCEPKAITVVEDDRNFIFRFETDGSLTAEDVLKKAMSLLNEQAQAFGKIVTDL
ncbi:MAG: DNA-directed RNA polymerase subunit D [Methanomassiliicoccaceae archaeon]|jgi:DNA-directed RNA polymerase subunit D|nr:DNA-directed RNA polymerase subunit D [Methanomassiliicoccaceae archaeon]